VLPVIVFSKVTSKNDMQPYSLCVKMA